MPADEPGRRRGSVLEGLLGPLRLPAEVMRALDSLAEAAREVAPIRSELTRFRELAEPPLAELMPAVDRLDKRTEPLAELVPMVKRICAQTEPLAELLPELERIIGALGTRIDSLREVVLELQSEESGLNDVVGDLVAELSAMHETVKGLRTDINRVTNHLPEARGPLQAARDTLTDNAE